MTPRVCAALLAVCVTCATAQSGSLSRSGSFSVSVVSSSLQSASISTGATSALPGSSSTSASAVTSPSATSTQYGNFPPSGSVPEDFSSSGLEKLWDIVSLQCYSGNPFCLSRWPFKLGWASAIPSIHHDGCTDTTDRHTTKSSATLSLLVRTCPQGRIPQHQTFEWLQVRRGYRSIPG
jgi:hypothetical protein